VTREQKNLAEIIVNANGGCVRYNLTQAAKIAGRSRTGFPAWLHERGVMVERTGKDKYINVNDLAVAMTKNRVSPL